jgi:hypothetical protein
LREGVEGKREGKQEREKLFCEGEMGESPGGPKARRARVSAHTVKGRGMNRENGFLGGHKSLKRRLEV